MKKILTFISLFIMILTLSSCGVKKEIKEKTLPDGNTLDEESISQYAEEIKTIYDSEVENYNKLETSWYSISTDAITEEETENNDYTEKTKAWLNMEYLFYDTPLSYESKSKMTITCKVETEKIYTSVDRIDENENAVINLKAKVIKIDGKVYLDLDVKTKTNNSESKTNQKYSYDASSFDMSYIESIIRGLGIDVSLDVIFDDGISFNQSLKKTMYQSFEKIGNKKDSGTTTSDDTISAVIKSKKGFCTIKNEKCILKISSERLQKTYTFIKDDNGLRRIEYISEAKDEKVEIVVKLVSKQKEVKTPKDASEYKD